MKTTCLKASVSLAVGASLALTASAAIVNVGSGAFTPLAPEITFSEFSLGTINPSITVSAGSLGNVTVSTAGTFVGQSLLAMGGGVNSISGAPTVGSALTLNTAVGAATVSTVNDSAVGATSPVLSGSPRFNGPISVLFSKPVAAVGLKGGYFDNVGSTKIEAYDALGNVLGSVYNTILGFEFYGLADSSGAALISGISFYINGSENGGFEIDNLTIGAPEQINIPTPGNNAPDAASTVMMLSGAMGALSLVRRQLKK